jgi:hypothetical protein
VYTVSFRLVLEINCGAVNKNEGVITVPAEKLKTLAEGLYYMNVTGRSDRGKAVSKPKVLVITQ